MTMMRHIFSAILASLFLVIVSVSSARAQGSSEASGQDHFSAQEAARFSKQIERDLGARGARLAIIFRAGRSRDKLPDAIRYTHGAFWVYQQIKAPDNSLSMGYATYNLFHGDGETLPKTRSYLKTEFPFDFITGSVVDDVAIIVPTPEMQRRLINILASDTYSNLHNADYSLISNPFDPSFQNCTEFILDNIAAAIWETDDYTQIKANLSAHFRPATVPAGLFGRLFGPMVNQQLRTSDHRGQAIRTTTFSTLSAFMLEFDLADTSYDLTFDRSNRLMAPTKKAELPAH